MNPQRGRPGLAALTAITLLAGCGDADGAAGDGNLAVTVGEADGEDTSVTAGAVPDDECSPAALNDGDEEFVFISAFRVVDGTLAERCFGIDDPTIGSAWESLATIAPATQLGDLAIFAGFEPDGDNAAETLAFVNALDANGNSFQMSVNVAEAVIDPDELLLTLAHEFTHVFTSTATQLDRTDDGVDTCATYFNGEGCYADDSLMLAWIDEFWDELLESVDPLTDSAINLGGTLNLLEGLRSVDFGGLLVYASTNKVYGRMDDLLSLIHI